MKRARLFLAAIMSVFMVFGLNAQYYTYHHSGHNGPEMRIKKKIKKGIRSGELTKKEVRKLHRELDQLDRVKRRAWRDGHLSRRDRKKIRYATYDVEYMLDRYLHNNKMRHGKRYRNYDGYGDYDYYYKGKKGRKKGRH